VLLPASMEAAQVAYQATESAELMIFTRRALDLPVVATPATLEQAQGLFAAFEEGGRDEGASRELRV